MIAIIDYGAGNLFSVKNALDFLGLENKITNSAADLSAADRLILPGVGAFPDAMRMLGETGLIGVIKEEVRKKPLLGICLGMQMLFEKGYEFGETDGLGLIPGSVKLMRPAGERAQLRRRVRQQVHCGMVRLWNEGPGAGVLRKRIRGAVPPGKERRNGAEYSQMFC